MTTFFKITYQSITLEIRLYRIFMSNSQKVTYSLQS